MLSQRIKRYSGLAVLVAGGIGFCSGALAVWSLTTTPEVQQQIADPSVEGAKVSWRLIVQDEMGYAEIADHSMTESDCVARAHEFPNWDIVYCEDLGYKTARR